jgi:hypothetical protein
MEFGFLISIPITATSIMCKQGTKPYIKKNTFGPSLHANMNEEYVAPIPSWLFHLINVEIIFILSDTSSSLWVQASKMVTCGTFLKIIII